MSEYLHGLAPIKGARVYGKKPSEYGRRWVHKPALPLSSERDRKQACCSGVSARDFDREVERVLSLGTAVRMSEASRLAMNRNASRAFAERHNTSPEAPRPVGRNLVFSDDSALRLSVGERFRLIEDSRKFAGGEAPSKEEV